MKATETRIGQVIIFEQNRQTGFSEKIKMHPVVHYLLSDSTQSCTQSSGRPASKAQVVSGVSYFVEAADLFDHFHVILPKPTLSLLHVRSTQK